jgi:hypothetical protein
VFDGLTKQYKDVRYPNKNYQTEQYGSRQIRQRLYEFNKAGFDVLAVDKRGKAYSGGFNTGNSAEMG